MNINTISLIPRRQHGWRMGLTNMLSKENFSWWRTRRWWIQCLLWLALLNGTVELNIRGDFDIANAGMSYFMMAGFGVAIAAISMAQDSILGEKHAGTAAWVLSKPLRRPAYLLSKLFAFMLGFLVTAVVIPGIVLYVQLTLHGLKGLSLPGFSAALGLVYLNTIFYMTLAFMLATLFNGRGPVLGITLGLLLAGIFIMLMASSKFLDLLLVVLPWRLLTPGAVENPLAAYLAMGAPLPTLTPIIATALWCPLFVGVAIWRIRREEF